VCQKTEAKTPISTGWNFGATKPRSHFVLLCK